MRLLVPPSADILQKCRKNPKKFCRTDSKKFCGTPPRELATFFFLQKIYFL